MDKPVKKIKCLVVDDEPLAREVISRFIARVPSLQLVAECENAIQAMTIVQQQEIELAFVDIQMPELLGTEFIKILQHPPKMILTTAYPEYALEGYDLDVVDYLLKPIQFERFLKAINKAALQIGVTPQPAAPPPAKQEEKPESYFYFRTDRKMVKVMLDEIIYIEGMKNYIRIITDKGAIITKNSMAAVEAMLPEAAFIRTHRSYIVSRSKIRSFTGEVIGIGSTEIPIGKLFKNNVMKALAQQA
ncbi:LytR/AlgR family response regulator transcription factor [Puia dinghuensis]|uniref:DNA-binding response regulator n=1 Tax=Puia dinghuensis TaxID=1792502 RepID=A0A8J2XTE4_9BACT|nr:LytTR family DNA-binding domain-containing protein [Puia dinghuensis]GGB02690.1 DNA-binding response regulator [Puia dinghuensis]